MASDASLEQAPECARPEFRSYRCFGCSPENARGLKLVFAEDGHGVSAAVRLGPDLESFPGFVHGGIVTTLLDEAMGRAVFAAAGRPAFTVGLRARFIEPVRTGRLYRLSGGVDVVEAEIVRTRASLGASDGRLIASATATFRLASPEVFGSSSR